MVRAQQPTLPGENSPLLPNAERSAHVSYSSGDISPLRDASVVDRDDAAKTSDESDGGDVERQTSNADSPKHQGLPEVKKRMPLIFPAIAIGVCVYTHYPFCGC